MTNPLRKLPLDLSDFARLRREGYVYVDKTRQIHQMVTSAIYFFLSRPRRFGKSLTVSTLNYLFRGERELFDGYLTIKDCDNFGQFTLGFPNEEVRAGFYEQLLFSGGDDYLPLHETSHAL